MKLWAGLVLVVALSGCHFCSTAAGLGFCGPAGAAIVGGGVEGSSNAILFNHDPFPSPDAGR